MALPFFGRKPPPDSARKPHEYLDDPDPQSPAAEADAFADFAVKSQLMQFAEMVQVQEVSAGIDARAEDAAMAWAAGDAAAAERVLREALADPATAASDGLWRMLLDLHRLSGERLRFEELALDFATRFECSPPPWDDLSGAPATPRGEAVPLLALAGRLSSELAAQLQQIELIARKGGAVRIDLARVRDADAAACTLLRQAITDMRAKRIKVWLLNGGELAEALGKRVRPGEATAPDTWLLLLELMQAGGDEARFEELELDYAITFELSPPSWEAGRQTPEALNAVAGGQAAAIEPGGEAFRLEGELFGAGSDAMRRMLAYAADRERAVIDCERLRRVDFVCAGSLLNELAKLQATGRRETLIKLNALVDVLLRVMGIAEVASLSRRA